MDQRLQELLDHHDIRRLLAVYCHGCDRSDVARMASVYADDSWDDHGPAKMSGQAFAERAVGNLDAGTEMCMHHLGQSLIQVDGDVAGAETYFIATLRRALESGEILDQMGGRYVDRLERGPDGWRVKHRTCVREWSIRLPVTADWLAGQSWVEGMRSRADPSYAVLGLAASAGD